MTFGQIWDFVVPFIPIILSGGLGYFVRIFWEKHKLKQEHKLRIIEEHTKKLHEYVEKHYLKISNRAFWVADSLKKIQDRKARNPSVQPLKEDILPTFRTF